MNVATSTVRRRFLVLGVITTALLSGCTGESVKGYEGYVEGKFVYVASPQGGRLDELSVRYELSAVFPL
jgi:hypothetical protein